MESSTRATPVAPVLISNGAVRICGNFKVSLNPYLDTPVHPMPVPDESFTELNCEKLFTKLELSNAYQQAILDEKSRPFVIVTSHLGLYRYTRLPFVVALAPEIFQQIVDKMLNGLAYTIEVLPDDLVVMGESYEQRLETLHRVLTKFKESGAKFKKSKRVIMQPKVKFFVFVDDFKGINASTVKVFSNPGSS